MLEEAYQNKMPSSAARQSMGPHPELVRARLAVGQFGLTILSDGACLFDGGAMFGVVPKTLWSRRIAADEQNRVLLGLNTVVVRTGTQVVVIETGLGGKLTAKQKAIYGAQGRLPQALVAAGIDPERVDVVINTHLHWDHCGWNTTHAEDSSLRPTFPNARYFAHRGEVEHGRRLLERDAVSYIADNYEPLLASGQMTLIDPQAGEEHEIAPGRTLSGPHPADARGAFCEAWTEGLLHLGLGAHDRAPRPDLGYGFRSRPADRD